MGRLLGGVNGQIHGKVGNMIGSSRNGVPYVKGPYKKRTQTVSSKELLNRKKFAVAQAWLHPVLAFVREGFRGYSKKSQGFVAAKSWLLKNGITGDEEALRIDPALVKLSYGDLPNPENIAVTFTEDGNLKFTWNPKYVEFLENDQIMMLAYDVERSFAFHNTTGQLRSTGFSILPIDHTNIKKFHVYAAFNAADRSRQSDSVYLGEWEFNHL
jgi:hypothetical protein